MKPEDNHRNSNSVSQYVWAAEELLTSGKYGMALEALSIAQEMDPQNSNVQATVERALMLQAQVATNPSEQSELSAERTSSRTLSTTVGKQFDRGIKSVGEVSPSPQEIHAKVKYLVDTAAIFIDRGMNESAFESLMRAYLLDPLAPEVISSEEKLLPLLEVMRNSPTRQLDAVHYGLKSTPQSKAVATDQGSATQEKTSLLKRWRLRR